jgi:hypothetical protein
MRDFEVFLLAVDDKDSFLCNLASNLSATRAMLLREACLVSDFQVFIGSKGGIFHVDLDRCMDLASGKPKHWRKLPLPLMAIFERMLTFTRQFIGTAANCSTAGASAPLQHL